MLQMCDHSHWNPRFSPYQSFNKKLTKCLGCRSCADWYRTSSYLQKKFMWKTQWPHTNYWVNCVERCRTGGDAAAWRCSPAPVEGLDQTQRCPPAGSSVLDCNNKQAHVQQQLTCGFHFTLCTNILNDSTFDSGP